MNDRAESAKPKSEQASAQDASQTPPNSRLRQFEELSLDAYVKTLNSGARRQGRIRKKRFGKLEGRLLRYSHGATSPVGAPVEIRAHAFMGRSCVYAFIAWGFPETLDARTSAVEAILASMSVDAVLRSAP